MYGSNAVNLSFLGKDATESFDDVGHSKDAQLMKDEYLVGHLHPVIQANIIIIN